MDSRSPLSLSLAERQKKFGARSLAHDDALLKWFQEREEAGQRPTKHVITEKAQALHKDLNLQHECSYSSGWVYKFKYRHGLLNKDLDAVEGKDSDAKDSEGEAAKESEDDSKSGEATPKLRESSQRLRESSRTRDSTPKPESESKSETPLGDDQPKPEGAEKTENETPSEPPKSKFKKASSGITHLTIQEKLELLKKREEGLSRKELCQMYNIGRTTFYDISRKKDRIIELANEEMNGEVKLDVTEGRPRMRMKKGPPTLAVYRGLLDKKGSRLQMKKKIKKAKAELLAKKAKTKLGLKKVVGGSPTLRSRDENGVVVGKKVNGLSPVKTKKRLANGKPKDWEEVDIKEEVEDEEEEEAEEAMEVFDDVEVKDEPLDPDYPGEPVSKRGRKKRVVSQASPPPATTTTVTHAGPGISFEGINDSRVMGQHTLKWIIYPKTETEFFRDYWEKQPLHIKHGANYFNDVFSTAEFDRILRNDVVHYTKNLDVTSYSDGQRETHNIPGRALAPVVWDYYNNGCSLRLLNPQTFSARVWRLLSRLQEYFNSFCGANVYLTPPDSQGFAPHWDDIEAFILQLEGQKRWRVYKPRTPEETLPTYSSKNLTQEEIGDPILDVTLEPGDLLYFPRGFIHQGHTVEGFHSLHITLSTYQKNSWGHFFEKMLPQALSVAMAEDVEFRKGLPRAYLNCMGVANLDQNYPGRQEFITKVGELMARLLEKAPLDAAVDQMGVNFIHDCLPPHLTQEEKDCSVYRLGERWCPDKKKVVNRTEIDPDTPIRLVRGNCIRLVAEEECVKVYYTQDNSREYHAEESQYLELEAESAPAVEALLHAYPSYIAIEDLPVGEDAKVMVAAGLWERGLLVTPTPLEAQDDD